MRRALVIVLLGASHAARADAVVEEISAGASSSSSWLADKLAGIWDIDEAWQLRAEVAATRAFVDASSGAKPGDSLTSAASLEYAADDHWTLRFTAGWAPESTSFATDRLEDDTEVVLRATSASMSVGLAVGYDTAGESDHETSLNLSAGGSSFAAHQECVTEMCPPQATQLGQLALDASVTETLYEDTDFTLGAAYYAYDIDPSTAGYFTLASFGPGNLGSAVGIVPTEYTLTPSVAHRWGALSVMASAAYGSYLDAQGYVLSANLRVQYKLKLDDARRLKLYAKLGGAWNVDEVNDLARSGSLGTGVQYSW